MEAQTARPRWLGVLGGMGPLATVDFMTKLIRRTPASRDQEHIPLLVASNCEIPDRVANIRSNGPDPWPALLRSARMLMDAEVARAVIPCSTAHHWFDRLEAEVPLRWLHIADAVGRDIEGIPRAERRIGLLAASGTVLTNLYPSRLRALEIEWIFPTSEEQDDLVDETWRAVKAFDLNRAGVLLSEAERRLQARGSNVVVLACSEFPSALAAVPAPANLLRIDALDALARWCVAELTT